MTSTLRRSPIPELPPVRTGDQQYQYDAHEHGLVLSEEEKTALIGRARSGDLEARESISLYFLPHCSSLAARYARAYSWAMPQIEYQDLAQLGSETVLNILDRALEHNEPFAYIYKYVRCEIVKYCSAHVSIITTPISHGVKYPRPAPMRVLSLDKPLRTAKGQSTLISLLADTLMSLSSSDQRDYPLLEKFISALPPRQREMVLRYHGLQEHASESFAAIARSCNMTRVSAHLSYKASLGKLKQSMKDITAVSEVL